MKSESHQSCLILCNPLNCTCQTPLSMGFFRQEYWSKQPIPPPGDLPNRGIEPRSPTLHANYLPSESAGKPIQSVGSLFLLYRIFLTQESNQSLLCCRRILYQLSYQGRTHKKISQPQPSSDYFDHHFEFSFYTATIIK